MIFVQTEKKYEERLRSIRELLDATRSNTIFPHTVVKILNKINTLEAERKWISNHYRGPLSFLTSLDLN